MWEVVDAYVIMSGSDGRPVFIAGGLSGQLALVGTNSGTALAVVGVLTTSRESM